MPAGFNTELRVGTLWTSTSNAMERLRGLYATGAIDDAEAGDLAHFIEHGWLLWSKAVDDARIDQLVHDIEHLHERPGYFATVDPATARKRLNGTRPDRIARILDPYVNLQSARQVSLHWRIARFLSLVLQAKPLLFQQAVTQVSNNHTWHQDPAYVVVDSPMLLTATCIALRDVPEGSGELAFYDTSHKLPPYAYANGRTHHDGHTSPVQYAADLQRECEARDLPLRRLLAKKGDVFFSTASLVHRNHPVASDHAVGLLACTTHYCPATSIPFWFADPELRGIEPFFDLGGFASANYRLPNLGQVIRPIPTWDYFD